MGRPHPKHTGSSRQLASACHGRDMCRCFMAGGDWQGSQQTGLSGRARLRRRLGPGTSRLGSSSTRACTPIRRLRQKHWIAPEARQPETSQAGKCSKLAPGPRARRRRPRTKQCPQRCREKRPKAKWPQGQTRLTPTSKLTVCERCCRSCTSQSDDTTDTSSRRVHSAHGLAMVSAQNRRSRQTAPARETARKGNTQPSCAPHPQPEQPVQGRRVHVVRAEGNVLSIPERALKDRDGILLPDQPTTRGRPCGRGRAGVRACGRAGLFVQTTSTVQKGLGQAPDDANHLEGKHHWEKVSQKVVERLPCLVSVVDLFVQQHTHGLGATAQHKTVFGVCVCVCTCVRANTKRAPHSRSQCAHACMRTR